MIEFIRGDTPTVRLTLADDETFEAGDVVYFTAKTFANDADANALVAVDSSDLISFTAGESVAEFVMPADAFDSVLFQRDVFYDWQLVRDPLVATLESGRARILVDVTRRTTVTP